MPHKRSIQAHDRPQEDPSRSQCTPQTPAAHYQEKAPPPATRPSVNHSSHPEEKTRIIPKELLKNLSSRPSPHHRRLHALDAALVQRAAALQRALVERGAALQRALVQGRAALEAALVERAAALQGALVERRAALEGALVEGRAALEGALVEGRAAHCGCCLVVGWGEREACEMLVFAGWCGGGRGWGRT